ncbi:MAG: 16S rRNA (cytosine(967)-C(5))-methyltransferase RsmB [Gammaproteobacteria bacterium]|nr:16S rRNA (cytosine(967)-C(5))-methyltransferase RsmB [Gammaproteobacteria bacterium]
MKTVNTRVLAAQVIGRVVHGGQSLTAVLYPAMEQADARNRGLLQELCYGVLRWYPQLQYLVARLLDKPLRSRDGDVQVMLLLGLYQLLHLRIPEHAAVAEAVAATRALGKDWATGLVNAVLRNFQRRRGDWLAALDSDASAHSAHPLWLLQRIQADWPTHWPALIAANNSRPPYHLRVNPRRLSRAAYLERLAQAGIDAEASPVNAVGVTLTRPCETRELPGFTQGWVSVQDTAAQLAAQWLAPQPGERVLDACAAPGGKTAHLLEIQPELGELWALDKDETRLQRVRDNLERLGLQATLRVADATQPESWWDGRPFDRILVDAPCSASGVIRRHPDIKVLRRATDIESLTAQQRMLLEHLWPLLAAGGTLLYSTCSVLRLENEQVIDDFLTARPDARERFIDTPWGVDGQHGRQLLPGEWGMDGFFYAALVKND